MIESITITNYRDESITLTLTSPEESGLYVRKIIGLDPPKATINMTESLNFDGATFNSSRVTYRNIVMALGFFPRPIPSGEEGSPGDPKMRPSYTSVEDMRQETYIYFPLKRQVKVVVKTTNRELEIYGYVESNNINMFSKRSETVISILCPEAYFKTLESIVTVFLGTIDTFTFPFSNESLIAPLIEFGEILVDARKNIIYDGDTETGIIITVLFRGDVEGLSITNTVSGQTFVIDDTLLAEVVSLGFSSGDELTVNTLRGSKSMTLKRNGVVYNIINARVPGSDWLTVDTGDNDFFFSATLGGDLMNFQIEYHPLYQGV